MLKIFLYSKLSYYSLVYLNKIGSLWIMMSSYAPHRNFRTRYYRTPKLNCSSLMECLLTSCCCSLFCIKLKDTKILSTSLRFLALASVIVSIKSCHGGHVFYVDIIFIIMKSILIHRYMTLTILLEIMSYYIRNCD